MDNKLFKIIIDLLKDEKNVKIGKLDGHKPWNEPFIRVISGDWVIDIGIYTGSIALLTAPLGDGNAGFPNDQQRLDLALIALTHYNRLKHGK